MRTVLKSTEELCKAVLAAAIIRWTIPGPCYTRPLEGFVSGQDFFQQN
jgi:hypothetical protein